MNKFLIGMALGAAAGMVLYEVPAVKSAMKQGKKKVKEMTK